MSAPELRVALDRRPVLVGQRPAALGDPIRQREVADVVQQPRRVRELALLLASSPRSRAMSRANRATAAAWRAARWSRMSSERINPASTPQERETYCSERRRARWSRWAMYENANTAVSANAMPRRPTFR